MSARYVVTTTTGYLTAITTGSHGQPGLTAMVLDSHECFRVVRAWRSEDVTKGLPRVTGMHGRGARIAEERASALARELNRNAA